ncbi:MAG: hypothetical protein AAFP69_19155 [Planctomycetota bacterium]
MPDEAIGFTVDSPGLELIDLGTEFAVRVGDAGAPEVHVFGGVAESGKDAPPVNAEEKKRLVAAAPRYDITLRPDIKF